MGGFEEEEQPLPPPDGRYSVITKGKRTKRLRTLSTATSSSSISGGGGGGGGGDYDFSPSSSSGTTVLGSTEEEVDMAYCLILLAQGPGRRSDERVDAKMESGELLRSNNRLSEAAISGSAATRTAFYVYECKTCSRTFPSFQALGGHRASHKKPRASEDAKKIQLEPSSDEDEEVGQLRRITIGLSPPSKLLQASRPKIHECSICRAEFSSGQALGGHMRRHRAAAAPSATSGLVTMNIDSMIADNHIDEHSSQGAIMSLDLNLPAPEDDRKFQLAEVPARKRPLFSGRALVDCYH